MSYKANLNLIKTWSWYKKMPKLKRELFDELFNESRGVSMTKHMVDDKYTELLALGQNIN